MFDAQLDPQYELLSKTLSSYFDPESRAFALSVFDTLGYTVNQTFEDPANEFAALGLVAKEGSKPPVLVLPGGRVGTPRTVGDEEFENNEQAIKAWLEGVAANQQLNPSGLKPDVTGASRGGALSQLVASEFPTLIGSAVTFVSPGIDRATAEKFLANGGQPSQVRHYITDGDWRSLIGDVFIPGKVTVGTYEAPIATSAGQVDYATRKHSSGILADFSAILTDTSDPDIARVRAITDKPSDLTLSEISVADLNRPDFSFVGKDWQALVQILQTNNPNLLTVLNRQGAEEVRDHFGAGNIFGLIDRAIVGQNPISAEQLNQPTAEDDLIVGSDCNDRIRGLTGDDYIRGNAGNDRLFGDAGNDALIGGEGRDRLNGGAGDDILTGGKGRDLFLFGDKNPFTASALGVDRINDFVAGKDLIGLSQQTFSLLSKNIASHFGTVADDAAAAINAAAIVYNTTNGKLFYNTNGIEAGFGEGSQFVSLFNQPTLSAESFILV
jgi:serralysin